MAIEYDYLERGAEALIAASELPTDNGIAVAVRTTGYEIGTDEVLQLAIVDLDGNELFNQTVKPQNIDEWPDEAATGGITPADVAEAPELYQFEDEISALYESASIVVGLHVGFIHEAIESSWVTLPDKREFDLADEFCAAHCAKDYPGQPAAVVTLQAIADFYGAAYGEATALDTARAVAAGYRAFVGEQVRERQAKDASYWEAHNRQMEEARRNDHQQRAVERAQEMRRLRVGALMWLCAAAIFSNLAVQMHVRGIDFGFVAVGAAAAVYFAVRWVMSLYAMYKLSRQAQSDVLS